MPRRFHLILIVVSLATGCAHHAKQPTSKRDVTAVSGFTKIEQGAKRISEAADHLKNSALSDVQMAYVGEVISGLGEINEGETDAKKVCSEAITQNQTNRQAYYGRIDWLSLGSGVVLAVGLGVVMMSIFSPVGAKFLGIGVGIACIGGSGWVVFLAMRGVDTTLRWAIPLVGAAIVAAIYYFIWERIQARRDRLKKERALVEVVATGEAVKARPDVPNEAIAEEAAKIQSPSTAALVQEVKANVLAIPPTEAASQP